MNRLSTRRRDAQAGFTLIEIMLALAIIGFLTATIWGTFTQTATTKRRIEAAQERVHTARVALMRMAREIEMAYLSGSENQLIADRRTMFVGTSQGDIDQLRFSYLGKQRMRADSAESDSGLVTYYAQRDPDNRSVMNLMRRETRRLEAKDPLMMPADVYILCPNVSRLKFAFYDFVKKEWRQDWTTIGADAKAYPPSHVRISLTVIDERGREVSYTTSARVHVTDAVDYRPNPS